jgi:hypothetical protein
MRAPPELAKRYALPGEPPYTKIETTYWTKAEPLVDPEFPVGAAGPVSNIICPPVIIEPFKMAPLLRVTELLADRMLPFRVAPLSMMTVPPPVGIKVTLFAVNPPVRYTLVLALRVKVPETLTKNDAVEFPVKVRL